MKRNRLCFLALPLLLATSIATPESHAQNQRGDDRNFYNGVRNGGRGGYYGRDPHYNDRGGYNRPPQGGIGPGKGALIGGAGGAALGAIFGGGLKGALIGGAAGAGVGAIAGKVHQNHQRDQYRQGYYPRGR